MAVQFARNLELLLENAREAGLLSRAAVLASSVSEKTKKVESLRSIDWPPSCPARVHSVPLKIGAAPRCRSERMEAAGGQVRDMKFARARLYNLTDHVCGGWRLESGRSYHIQRKRFVTAGFSSSRVRP